MINPEKQNNLIRKEKEKIDVNYIKEKLEGLGISAAAENIDIIRKLISVGTLTDSMFKEALESKNPELITKKIDRFKKWYEIAVTMKVKDVPPLTNEEAMVAVKLLDEIKHRFPKRGEKPRGYIESLWEILRDYNITLNLDDLDSQDNFPVKNEVNDAELKENIEKLVNQGIIDTDRLAEGLSEIYKDKGWEKYLVQKNVRKREIIEFLKIYPPPPKHFLKHHTIPKRILKRALYRELIANGLVKKIEKGIKVKKGKRSY